MTAPVPMCLVFRLGGIGFALPVEIVEEVYAEGTDDGSCAPAEWLYRGVRIPRVDLGARFGLLPESLGLLGPVLILKGAEVPLAVRVEKIEGVFPQASLGSCPVPPLLTQLGSLPYRQLLLWRDQPLVLLDQPCLLSLLEGL